MNTPCKEMSDVILYMDKWHHVSRPVYAKIKEKTEIRQEKKDVKRLNGIKKNVA